MELMISMLIGVLTCCGIFMMLRPRTFTVMLGLTMLSYAVNLFIFASGGLKTGRKT